MNFPPGILYGALLCLLETTFLFAAILILHSLRKVFGSAGLYISLGLLFVFTQLVGATELHFGIGISGFDFYLAGTVLFLPALAALMVIYIADGTLAAQRLIIGLLMALGIYAYLACITILQAEPGNAFFVGNSVADMLSPLMTRSLRTMSANVLTFAVDLFLIPVIFQGLLNLRCRLFLSVVGSLLVVQLADGLLYSLICFWGESAWWDWLLRSCFARSLFAVWLGILASIYIARVGNAPNETNRRALEIFIAFFGTFGRAKALEHDLKKTEERYRMLFQNAGDMIVVMDQNGVVADMNPAATEGIGLNPSETAIRTFQDLTGLHPEVWEPLLDDTEPDAEHPVSPVIQCSLEMPRTARLFELTISRAYFSDTPMLVVFGHDMTEKIRMEQEREHWREHVAHGQRLESIGQLAGGIAHDFNNILHAIQGHVDLIQHMYPVDDTNVNRHLHKIEQISDQASLLTRQLLGFARKGNYNEAEIELNAFVSATSELFLPKSNSFEFELQVKTNPARPLTILGDVVQLQQVLMNILFNACDAMKNVPERERRITMTVGRREELLETPEPPPELLPEQLASDFCVIRISDTGPGIDDTVKSRVFEPFFTTKPVGEGTGMGLSMAYGILRSHKGWIQIGDAEPHGAIFFLVLPLHSPDELSKTTEINIENFV